MNKDWLLLVQKFDVESARIKFENICESLFKKLYPKKTVRTVKVNQGDGGIDIFIGEIGVEPIHVIQCKFFLSGIDESQKSQIRESFKTVVESKEFEPKSWTLCIINLLDLSQNKWWSSWKKNVEKNYNLPNSFISLKDGNELVGLLKEHHLYNNSFELEDSIRLEEIHNKIVKGDFVPEIDVKEILKKASYPLLQVRNYIENKTITHITRTETKSIYDWIINELPVKQKNVLILKGEKGLGKSAILKDLYEKLEKEGFDVIGIKADKFYSNSISDLESKLFDNLLTFDKIIKKVEEKGSKIVVIIDQIDALSLTLSSNREFIETYNKLILHLQNSKYIRIIVSSRSYDLKYDAELSIYNSDEYRKVLVNPLSTENVTQTLSLFNINSTSPKLLQLLRVPNHLDIFCRIFDGNSKKEVDSISSLKDLYDQLWKKYVSPKRDLNLKKLIFCIAQKMYIEQRISVGNIYEDDYFQEIHYLNSYSLLSEYNKEIQFFHQSFYEYCFAKQFVENQESLEKYILDNEQSLYVRSVIKMVLEYLREYDIKKYINTVENILISPDYRFHVKSLVITNIGSVKYPCTLEKELVVINVLKRADYEEVFMNSVYSEGWMKFFMSENIFIKRFSSEKNINNEEDKTYSLSDTLFNSNWFIFRNNINLCSISILDYLDSISFENKDGFIAQLLMQIDDWSDENLLKYFEKYMPFENESTGRRENFWHYEILKRVFPNNREYTFNKLAEPILNLYEDKKQMYEFEYSLNATIEELYKHSPLETFQFLFGLYQQISKTHKKPYFNYENIQSPLYESSKLKDTDRSLISRGEKGIKHYLYEFIESSENSFILGLFTNYKNTDNVAIIKLIVRGLNTSPDVFKNEIIELIDILTKKDIFSGSDDNFQVLLRELISNIYLHLDREQTNFLNKILLNIKTTYDYWVDKGRKRVYLQSFGKKKYLFIKALPSEKIKDYENLYKTYQELNRKFGELNHKKAMHSSGVKWGSVGSPLKDSAYNNMSFKHWRKSMIKYNENYSPIEWLKGDIEQHSTAFSNKVKENPEKFYDFIESLFENKDISPRYVIKGIGGLIDGGYNPEKVKRIYKKFLALNIKIPLYQDILNHQAGYFVKNKNIDLDIVSYLRDMVINFPEKEKELNPQYPLHDAINSIRGSALYELMCCYYDKDFEEIIFSSIENVIENPLCNDSVRAMILDKLAYLNHLDIDRAFKIFSKLTDTDDVKILKFSINTAQYFNNKYHNEMEIYFNRILGISELHKESFVMISSWLLGLDNDKQLFNKFINKGKEAKLCALHVAEEFLIDKSGSVNDKALNILSNLLGETDKEFAHEYSAIILRKFKLANFSCFLPFLRSYSKSFSCKRSPSYFLQYLLKSSKDYPEECIELLSNMDFREAPNIQERGYYDKEPVQLILGIYSKLVSEINKNKHLINKSLDIFDNMLKHTHLRNNANQAIESMI
ncbi:NACHT domain-containing protein [Chryseobacterium sp. G0201]|uniref:NACHT domain-containing protein n=1 Tax=Chryseobacterium sp. G0201 TaxID=2487065 RepID=UPI000F5020C2|nr:ATP-binding protein [Chryseobacterium sp. G0201]AZA52765.1 AAA family ATPase [Chryseobacterium sp. G0201]